MGCISSKVIARSISFRDELNQKMGRMEKGDMPAPEEVFQSNKSNDQFLALVCAANTAHKLQNADIVKLESQDDPGADSQLKCKGVKEDHVDPPKRSKSWHQLPEEELFEWQSKLVTRSRSFHTVEEFDALLEKIRVTGSSQNGFRDESNDLGVMEKDSSALVATDQARTPNGNEPLGTAGAGNVDSGEVELVRQEEDSTKIRNKRRAVAKGPESLSIPTAVEFTAVGSLREWLQGGGQVSSPGSYVTPKFGSYSLTNSKMKHEGSEGYLFNPELVTAIEEHMQQLEVEEETILKQIAENWEDKVEENTGTVLEKEKCTADLAQ